MSTIEINEKPKDPNGRKIILDAPEVLDAETLTDLVGFLGEELVISQVKGAIKVSFRAMIRRLLAATDDNGDFVNSDEDIKSEDYTKWVPQLRVMKTPEEKAMEALGALPPEMREAVLANFAAGADDDE